MKFRLNYQQLAFGLEQGGNLSEKCLYIRHFMDHVESQGKINLICDANSIRQTLMGGYPGF